MHVGQFLFYNTYVPQEIRPLVDKYYSAVQNNLNSAYKSEYSFTKEGKIGNPNELTNRRDILLKYLINDDIQLSANSSYTTLNEFFSMGELGSLIDKTISTEGALTGVVKQSHANYRNIFNFSLWDKTEPMTINLKITLYSKTDPLIDVMIPAYLIMGHAGLDKILDESSPEQRYAVPGLSFLTAMYLYNKHKQDYGILETESAKKEVSIPEASKDQLVQSTDKGTSQKTVVKPNTKKGVNTNNVVNSKILSLLIDGLVYIDKGTVKTISITFSKHTAKTSEPNITGDFPIWAELDVQIESIIPATSNMLWDSLTANGKSSVLNMGKM
jgi:hypothetical protein